MTGLALSAFSGIARGMSLEQIIARLGTPVRETRMAAYMLEYAVNDGSKIEILFANPNLIKIIHYRNNGTRMTWVPTITQVLNPTSK